MTVVSLDKFKRYGHAGEPQTGFQPCEEVRFTEESRPYLQQQNTEKLMYLTGMVMTAENAEGTIDVLFPEFNQLRPVQAPVRHFSRVDPTLFDNTRVQLHGYESLTPELFRALKAVLKPVPDVALVVGLRLEHPHGARVYEVFNQAEIRETTAAVKYAAHYVTSVLVVPPAKRLGAHAKAIAFNRHTHRPPSFED